MPNRLAHETSPYLLQHQHNPVDWYPWGPEALAAAAASDRPILLSIGYSACHWCHVMERESFEDPATAAHMNAHFVNVKVDREERPDLDELYMRAVQAFTGGHGGWPMTVFLTPAGAPFFCGTYFPPTARQGMPSFRQVMDHVRRLYHEGRQDLAEVTAEMGRYLDASGRLPGPAPEVGDDWLERVARAAVAEHDPARGGFGQAPKFPPHGTLAVLLAHHHRTGDRQSLAMVTGTLDAMAKGGMYDQLAGGFARYSVDDAWRVPHFEKMLYDNAQLLSLYTDAWVLTGKPLYERVVRETAGFLLHELQDPQGGFWSALDADSEGEEGRYYAWTPAQVAQALRGSPIEGRGAEVCALLEVTDEGTFEHGASVLRLERPLSELPGEQQALLREALPALARARQERVRPGTDDKVITAWNALTISALARAAAAFDEEPWFLAAANAAAFLMEKVTVDGRLMRTWKAGPDGGRAHLPAYADDHAFLVQALIDLYQANFDDGWLRDANRLCDQLLALFWDDDAGGLFYTGHDAERLVSRSKNMMGGAEPAANAVAALAMVRLAALSDRPELRDRAELIVRCYRPLLEQAPRAMGAEALAAAWLAGPSLEIGLVGAFDRSDTVALLDSVRRRYLPFSVLAAVEPDADPEVLALLPWMRERGAPGDRATAYVCQGSRCLVPTQDSRDLAAQLDSVASPSPTRRDRPLRDQAPVLPDDPDLWVNAVTPLSLERLRGRIVVLDFWTSSCVNCQHVLPELAALEARLGDRPVTVIGVHSSKFPAEQEVATVRRAVRRHRLSHPVVHDPDQALWQAYGVQSWPTLVVLDAQGRIAWRHAGEVRREELIAVVEGLLAEGEQAGLLVPQRWPSPTTTLEDSFLDHPGKVHVYPDAAAQAMGAEPFGASARLYVSDTGHHRIVEASLERGADGWPVARVTRTFGSGAPGLLDARAPLARFQDPQGLARAGDALWVADTGNHALRKVDLPSGQVSTVAGTGRLATGLAQAQRRPLQTELRSPWDVAVAGADAGMPGGPQGQDVVFVAMAGMHQVWVYLAEHDEIGPFLGSGREDHVDGDPQEAALAQPSGLCLFGRYIFFVDAETSSVRAFDLAERKVGTVVGRGLFDFGDVDGPPEGVRLQHPLGLTLADGELYVADTFNGKIKVISLQGGHTRTLAGSGGELCEPGGVAVAGEFLLVADTGHHELKVIHRQTGELRRLPLR